MYAGVVEAAGAAPEPEGGIPYMGFGGSACKHTEGNVKACFGHRNARQYRLCVLVEDEARPQLIPVYKLESILLVIIIV